MILKPVGLLATGAGIRFQEDFSGTDGTYVTSRDPAVTSIGGWDSTSNRLYVLANTTITHNVSPWLGFQNLSGTHMCLKDIDGHMSVPYRVNADLIYHNSGTVQIYGRLITHYADSSNFLFCEVDRSNTSTYRLRLYSFISGSVTQIGTVDLPITPSTSVWYSSQVIMTIGADSIDVEMPEHEISFTSSIPSALESNTLVGLQGLRSNTTASTFPVADNFEIWQL